MGKSFFDKIQAKLELLRLEKRYTRSRHRRSAFVSNAVYVDGEYVFQTPNSTGSSTTTTASGGIDALHGDRARPEPPVAHLPLDEVHEEDEREADRRMDEEYQREQQQQQKQQQKQQRKRFNRFSTSAAPTPREVETENDGYQRKKLNRYSSMPGFGGGYDANKSTPRVQERRLSMIR